MLAFSMRKFFWGLAIAGFGGLVWASNLGMINISFRFGRDWPIIIVALGLMYVWDAIFGKHWWSHCCGKKQDKKEDIFKALEDLEKGKITPEEAIKRMSGK
ncbi:MAG TPA: hypothetical protein DCZ92_10730 [Elusimicrobia bacterium]|nr:MAG: hypothetical protein A2016_04420 [Elusimicrobia bacterium GWF2_62_30]HBA61269.1 hypothetical protein [Elusimicrobiota bacterium]